MTAGLETILERAYKRFLEYYPEIQNSINPNEADNLGISIEDSQELNLRNAIEKEVERINSHCSEEFLNINGFEFRMMLGSDSIDECLSLLMNQRKQELEQIGIDWDTDLEHGVKTTYEVKYRYHLGYFSRYLKP